MGNQFDLPSAQDETISMSQALDLLGRMNPEHATADVVLIHHDSLPLTDQSIPYHQLTDKLDQRFKALTFSQIHSRTPDVLDTIKNGNIFIFDISSPLTEGKAPIQAHKSDEENKLPLRKFAADGADALAVFLRDLSGNTEHAPMIPKGKHVYVTGTALSSHHARLALDMNTVPKQILDSVGFINQDRGFYTGFNEALGHTRFLNT